MMTGSAYSPTAPDDAGSEEPPATGNIARKRRFVNNLTFVQQYRLGRPMWLSYDAEADVLYINFKKPSRATDSELTDDDLIIRYEGEEVVGVTVLHASQR